MSDHYLEMPHFKEESFLANKTVVIALGTGKHKSSKERVVQGKV